MEKSGAKSSDKNGDEWRAAPVPDSSSLTTAAKAARSCTACHLYKHATQTVFGEGPKNARLMLLGEQPGGQEDLAGRPFVGPAGKLLDRALEEAGIERDEVYVTNAVKHFKWESRGKRRIHQKPKFTHWFATGHLREVTAEVCLPASVDLMAKGALLRAKRFDRIYEASAAGRKQARQQSGQGENAHGRAKQERIMGRNVVELR